MNGSFCLPASPQLRCPAVGAKSWKLIAAAMAVVALIVAGVFIAQGEGGGNDAAPAQVDTQLNALIGGFKQRFPWSSEMVDTLNDEGLLTTPQRVYELWTHFQMPCVGGKDMLAGKPEQTKSDLSQQFQIDVTMDQAKRLNDTQERMCAAMPPGGWSAPTS
jgi:hypothetical protein